MLYCGAQSTVALVRYDYGDKIEDLNWASERMEGRTGFSTDHPHPSYHRFPHVTLHKTKTDKK